MIGKQPASTPLPMRSAYKIARGGTEVDQFNLAIEFYKSVVASLQSYGDSLLNTLIK
jgi:hypothetical protein